MNQIIEIFKKSILLMIIMGMLFSCTNDSKKVREIYHDYRIVPLEWAYGMKNYTGPTGKDKIKTTMPKSSEVLILNGI